MAAATDVRNKILDWSIDVVEEHDETDVQDEQDETDVQDEQQEFAPRRERRERGRPQKWQEFVKQQIDDTPEEGTVPDILNGATKPDTSKGPTKTVLPTNWVVVFLDGFLWVLTFMSPKGGLIRHKDVLLLRQEIGRGSITGGKGREHYLAQMVRVFETSKIRVNSDKIIVEQDGLTVFLEPGNMLLLSQLNHHDLYLNESFQEACQMCKGYRDKKTLSPSLMVSEWETATQTAPDVPTITERQEKQVHLKGARCQHGNPICLHQMTERGQPRHTKRNGRERCVLRTDVVENTAPPDWQQ